MTSHLPLLCYTFFLIWLTSEAISSKWKRRKEECKVKTTFVLEEHASESLKECLMICDKLQNCLTVSRSLKENTCLLSDIYTVDDPTDNELEPAANWETYSKVVFPVARLHNPDPRWKWMTFDEATEICSEHWAGLGTPDQLLDAESLGYETCGCGWFVNGTNGMVIPRSKSCKAFRDEEGPKIMYCNNPKATAWCRLK